MIMLQKKNGNKLEILSLTSTLLSSLSVFNAATLWNGDGNSWFDSSLLCQSDNRTAQRHFGAVLIKAVTLEQQAGGTAALAFPAAPKHGLKLAAADLIGVFPHSPAALTSLIKAFEATRTTNTVTTQALML